MEILLFIVVFLLALDHSSITKILSRPMFVCSLIGLVSGKLSECVLVGATLEVYYISCEVTDNYIVRTPGFFFVSVIAGLYVVTVDTDTNTAMTAAYACLAVSMVVSYVLSLINTLFLPSARKAVEKGNDKGLFVSMLIPYLLNAVVYGVLTIVAYSNLTLFTETLVNLQEQYWFFSNGIAAITLLMPCISLAILLRNIGVNDVKGAVAGGVAIGLICATALTPQLSNLVIALVAICVGWLAYYVSSKESTNTTKVETTSEEVKEEVSNEGGAEKWW